MDITSINPPRREPWNKGKLVGQKAPFKPKDIWAMRMRLKQEHRTRELALLNLGLDSKLRACDLASLKVPSFRATFTGPTPNPSCGASPWMKSTPPSTKEFWPTASKGCAAAFFSKRWFCSCRSRCACS